MEKYRNTASEGELTKINVEGCKGCGKVYVSTYNSVRLQVLPGWHLLANLQQTHPGERGQDVVIRVRGRVWGGVLGQRVCPDCKTAGIK
jgi:hypothetical protein